jgi:hypothetical protein
VVLRLRPCILEQHGRYGRPDPATAPESEAENQDERQKTLRLRPADAGGALRADRDDAANTEERAASNEQRDGPGTQRGRLDVARLADLEADNPNVRQQLEDWRKQREANGEDPNDYAAFRQHLLDLGAPDPGEETPEDFGTATA